LLAETLKKTILAIRAQKWPTAKRLYWVKPPSFLRRMYGNNVLWELPQHPNTLFLTFDDGPVPEATPEVLRILNDFGIKATFFSVGDNVRKHPKLYEQILSEGHLSGNHTHNHLNGWKTGNYSYIANILESKKYINSTLFRPPYGHISPHQVKILKKHFKIIMWSLLSADFDIRLTANDCINILEKYTKGGQIIVFHDNPKAKARLLKALPVFIEEQLKKGLTFETLNPQML